MVDYSKSKLYKIIDGENIIYGATASDLRKRLNEYKKKLNKYNLQIILIKNIRCNNKDELNSILYNFKQEMIEEPKQDFKQENKIICECGEEISKKNISRHRQSIKHLKLLENNH